jgi:hypothetical protein
MQPRRVRLRPAGCGVLAVALATAALGCGGSSGNGVASKSAPEILAASRAAAAAASSVRITGRTAQGPISSSFDVALTRTGGSGRVTLLGLTFDSIRVGDTLYVKGSPQLYERIGGPLAKAPHGVWVKLPASNPNVAAYASLTTLASETARLLTLPAPITKGASTTIDGQPAIELKETRKLSSSSIYIATSGDPYPIRIVKHGRETGTIAFSGWNQRLTVTAPAPAAAGCVARSSCAPRRVRRHELLIPRC